MSAIAHPSTFRDLTGAVFGHLTVLRYVGTGGDTSALWACECRCGREDCPVDVTRSTRRLRRHRTIPDCREFRFMARNGVPAPGHPPYALVGAQEGPRPPWTRSADERAARDAKLLAVFSRADLR